MTTILEAGHGNCTSCIHNASGKVSYSPHFPLRKTLIDHSGISASCQLNPHEILGLLTIKGELLALDETVGKRLECLMAANDWHAKRAA